MKKTIAFALCLLAASVSGLKAQERSYVPQEGDWGFSINAAPALGFIGNLFNGASENELNEFGGKGYFYDFFNDSESLVPTVSISGKRMLSENLGVRVNLGWLYTNFTRRTYVTDDAAAFDNALSQKKVTDSRNYRSAGLSCMLGAEYRVGSRRVQGIFGGGVLYANRLNRIQSYDYGNAMTRDNQTPSIASSYVTNPIGDAQTARVLKANGGNQHFAGIMTFLGVECFLARQISLGGEVNVAATYAWGGKQTQTVEWYNPLTTQVEKWTDLVSPNSRGFIFGTGNFGASLSLNFYF